MQEDQLSSLAVFVAKVLAGIELTSLYLSSSGTAYPPIEEDVTFYCVKPCVFEFVFKMTTKQMFECNDTYRFQWWKRIEPNVSG